MLGATIWSVCWRVLILNSTPVLQYVFFFFATYRWNNSISHLNRHLGRFSLILKSAEKYLKITHVEVRLPDQQHNNPPIERELCSQKCPNKSHCWSQIDHLQHIHDNSLAAASSNPAGPPLFCFSSIVCPNNRSANHIRTILLIIEIILVIILFCRQAPPDHQIFWK